MATIPPIMADDDPFEETREELMEDPFGEESIPTSSEALATAFETPKGVAPPPKMVATSAFDPLPPDHAERVEMGIDEAKTKHFYLQRELERAAEPLMRQLGPSFEKLSTFGYSEPTTDPGGAKLPTILRKLVRNI